MMCVGLAVQGVRFNCVCPGTIDTPLMHGAVADFASKKGEAKDDLYTWLATAQPFPRIGTPDEVAHAVAFIGKVPFIVGAQLSVDGGYTCQ
jgi:NAD(P)-dependent dehydrogenase (short-subunit alcohol dehydrogenase family)